MAYEAVRSISLKPVAAEIQARRFVTLARDGANAGLVVYQSGVDDTFDIIGITLESSPLGVQAAMPVALIDGARIELEASEAIAPGSRVRSDGLGRAINAATDRRTLGYALTRSAQAGEFITIMASKMGGHIRAVTP